MGYYTGGSLTLTASGWGPGNYSDCHKRIVASIKLPDASNTLSYTLTSSSDSSAYNNPYARMILYVRDNSNSNNNTNIISYYDSGYQSSSFPHANTTVSGTLDTKGFTQLKIDLYLYISNDGNTLSASDTGNITRTWIEDTFTVKFYDRGILLKTETVSSGGSATPPSVEQRLGWHFTGWDEPYNNITKNVDIQAEWDKNQLIVNYYSNYANKVRDSKAGVTKNLESTQNVYIRQDKYTYGNEMVDTLRNYSGHSDENTLIMRRHGYLPTRYWNTQPNGTGYSLHEGAGTPGTDTVPYVEDVAKWLGVNIDYNNATINIYPQWELQTEMYILKDGTIYAGDFISSSSNYIDKNGTKIYASSFTEGSSTIAWGADGFKAKAFRHGSPDFPYAAII